MVDRVLWALVVVMSLSMFFVVENTSSSIPKGFYIRDIDGMQVGDYAAFPVPPAGMQIMESLGVAKLFERNWLLKPIVAASGDTVCRNDNDIVVNRERIGVALDKSPVGGFDLPRWNGCIDLGKDEIFVFTDYAPFSIDGRYFGPIARSSAHGYTKLFTWK